MVPHWKKASVQMAMELAHPYEVVAHQWNLIGNEHQNVGSGMAGQLNKEKSVRDFLLWVKEKFELKVLRHTPLCFETVSKIAWCGGSGDFLLEDAIASGAQVFISSDFKYHRFFDHESKIIVLDIGHYETEKCVIDLLSVAIVKKFTTFAVHKTGVNTNPVQYF
jgi:putative NIF3 family GTP cyclohydrolase 1 type 2